MAAPKGVKLIGVKVPNANIGEFVILRNLTKGGQLTQQLRGTDRSTVFNAAPSVEWENDDDIQVEIRGRLQGFKRARIKDSGLVITIGDATADTTTPGVSL